MIVSFWRNRQLSAGKNHLRPLNFSWDIAKICFGYFGYIWLCTSKVILSIWGKCFCLSASKKSVSNPILFLRYYKNVQTYFGYFRHSWLYTTKMIVSTCRGLWCLSACQKQSLSFTSSLRYYILKNPAILLTDCILSCNWRPIVLLDIGLVLKYQ